MANSIDAVNAYSSAAKGALKSDAGAGTDSTFGNLVKEGMESAVNMQHKSEQMSAKAIAGKADMTDVLQAVTDAELALNTVIAVRDKVVQAYRDVMGTQM
jgi:flagellar hook-basal body complex protein FliE